jgi:outer membrane receptor protein involved in Fe transport
MSPGRSADPPLAEAVGIDAGVDAGDTVGPVPATATARTSTRRMNQAASPRRALVLAVMLVIAGGALASPEADSDMTAPEASPPDLLSMSLEDLLGLEISSASRFPQHAHAAPSAVRVLHADEIRAHGWRTLGDALASLPGLYTSYDRSYSYLGARGFQRPGDYNSRFLLLVDGYRLNDSVYGQATIGTDFPIDMELVERIEYAPGPGSAVYGSSAYFGVINVITRWPETASGGEGLVEAGSAGSVGAVATLAGKLGAGTQALLSASDRRRDGEDLHFPEYAVDGADGIARGLDGERVRRLLLQARREGATFSLSHMKRHKEMPTAAFDQAFGEPGSFVQDSRTMLSLGIERTLAPTLQLYGNVVYGRTDYHGDYVYEGSPLVVNRDSSESTWLASDWRVLSTAIDRHTLVAGVDLQHDFARDQSNYDLDPVARYLDDRRDGSRAGVFVNDELELARNLLLNVGLRYDHDSETGGDFSPRLALIRQSAATTWKLVYGRAFRSPNAYELFYEEQGSYSQLANPDLEPERIGTFELMATHELGRGTTLDGLLYHYDLSGLISQVPTETTGAMIFQNQGSATATGAEFGFAHRWQQGASLRASYAHARVDVEGDGRLTNSPRNLVKLNAIVPLLDDRLRLALEARHVSRRDGQLASVPSYSLLNASVTLPQLPGGLELQATAHNLLGKRYFDAVGPEFRQNAIEQDGRRVMLTLRARFW